MKKDGEILLAMDANAKIGLLGENISRNGHKLLNLISNTGLSILNKSKKCEGTITRKNAKNENEISAIDFILASDEIEKWTSKIMIDEDGLYKISGKNDTDHNSIILNIKIPDIDTIKRARTTIWNLKASNEKWEQFAQKLKENEAKASAIISDTSQPFDKRYKN